MIPKSNLDDRTFDDIVAEAIRLIPRYCPAWTNHNPTDPGILDYFNKVRELSGKMSLPIEKHFVNIGNNPMHIISLKYTLTRNEEFYTAIVDLENEIGEVSVYFSIKGGIISFNYTTNDYQSVEAIGGCRSLAQAMYIIAKKIDTEYLAGRTVEGIENELQIHWFAYQNGILTGNSRIADMGGTNRKKPGFDNNAFLFEKSKGIRKRK